MRQPPVSVPERDRGVRAEDHPQRHVEPVGRWPAADEHGEDDAHRLLGVVAAVSEAERGRRHELAVAEPAVEALRRCGGGGPPT